MPICTILAFFLFMPPAQASQASAPGGPVQQANPAKTDQSKINPAKEADIRHLLELTGTKEVAAKSMNSMMQSMRPLMSNSLPPGDYRDKLLDLFFAKFQAKANLSHVVDLAVPLYDKHFSHEEIKGLIQFYETPLGKKLAQATPELALEIGDASRQWGQDLGQQSMEEVLAEHPDLAAAMDAASKAQQ